MVEAVLLFIGVILLSLTVRTTFGFGDALINMPLLALLFGLKVAAPLSAMLSSTITLAILIMHWRRIDLKSAWRLIVASLAGIPIGLWMLKGINESAMMILLALVLIGTALSRMLHPDRFHLKSTTWAFPFGFVAGVLGGAYNTNGPPVVVYGSMRHWDADTFRATIQGYTFPVGLTILFGHYTTGLWTRQVGVMYLTALPVIAAAFLIGNFLHGRLKGKRFQTALHILLIVMGMALILKAVLSYI